VTGRRRYREGVTGRRRYQRGGDREEEVPERE
jgi:hypothetical protein